MPELAGKAKPNGRRPVPMLARFLIPIAIGLAIWAIPPPAGVSEQAMAVLAVFVATIAGIIAKPLPMGAVAMIALAVLAVTKTLTTAETLSGFSNATIWLIVVAFFIARGFIKTGLGTRIAYLFVARLGAPSLGVSYGLLATDLVLAPAIPSNTARAGGVINPIVRSVSEAYGSRPDDGTARRLGSFLTLTAFNVNCVTSAMLLGDGREPARAGARRRRRGRHHLGEVGARRQRPRHRCARGAALAAAPHLPAGGDQDAGGDR